MKKHLKCTLSMAFCALLLPLQSEASGITMRAIQLINRPIVASVTSIDTSEERRLRRLSARLSHSAVDSALDRFYGLINSERVSAGLSPFRKNMQLQASAQAYAETMEKMHCFSHDDCGSTLHDRIAAYGYMDGIYQNIRTGENLAYGQEYDAEAVVDWMHSESHRNAILSTKYTNIGIGKSGKYRVIHFGARLEP